MDIQRLRNLTTGKLHTSVAFVYEDLGLITGEEGLMTHMLPRALEVVMPWLKANVTDDRFWNGEYAPDHTGEYDLPTPTKEERAKFFEDYKGLPNPLEGKETIVVEAV